MKKRILVTHNDLDGIGSAILFKYICELKKYPYEIYMIDVKEADSILEKICKEITDNSVSHLYIVDVSPKDKTLIEKLTRLLEEKNDFSLKLLDHHETAEPRFKNCTHWAKFKFTACGALLFYTELLEKEGFGEIRKLESFAKIVDDYDRFVISMPESLNMNLLFHLLGRDGFIDRCLNSDNPALFSQEEALILEYMNRNNELYIDKKIKSITPFSINNAKIAVVFADQLANEISMTMRDRKMLEYDCVAVIDISKKKVSLRYVTPNFNVGELASHFHQRGGGHIESGGFTLEDFKTDIFIKEVFQPIR